MVLRQIINALVDSGDLVADFLWDPGSTRKAAWRWGVSLCVELESSGLTRHSESRRFGGEIIWWPRRPFYFHYTAPASAVPQSATS